VAIEDFVLRTAKSLLIVIARENPRFISFWGGYDMY
jgi:hypothetical protein